MLQAGLDRGLPSVALRVEQGDQILFEDAAGFASTENQTPATETDRFRIASATKTFTSVLVLQQVDEGVLTLEDTISHWLDDPVVSEDSVMSTRSRSASSSTTRAASTTSSTTDSPFWQDAYFGEGVDWTRVWTPQELLAYLDGEKHAPYFAPGKGVHYSNAGYYLLGLILERRPARATRICCMPGSPNRWA